MLTYTVDPNHDDDDTDLVEVHAGTELIAWLSWYNGSDGDGVQIESIEVYNPAYRRQGIATAMLRFAEQFQGGTIAHSTNQSEDAIAWAKTTGNPSV